MIYLAVALLGAVSYLYKNYDYFIIALFFILSMGFGFVAQPTFKLPDLALGMCLICSVVSFFQNTSHFNIKGDPVAAIIFILLGYYTVVAVFTIATGTENMTYGLKVWRLELLYLSYFSFRKIPYPSVMKALKVLSVITLITAVFYLLQYVGIEGVLISKAFDEGAAGSSSLARFRNFPLLTTVCIFYFLFCKKSSRYRWIYILILFAVIIFMQSRGEILATLAAVALYFLIKGEVGRIVKAGLVLLVLALLFLPVIEYTFQGRNSSGNASFTDEVGKGLNIASGSAASLRQTDIEGTFIFRMVLLRERMDFLFSKSRYLFGVGTIHEDSPNNRFSFVIGSQKIDDKGDLVYQQIDTNDIAFVTHIFRYGFLYLVIFLAFLCFALKKLYKNSRLSVVSLIAFLLLMKYIIQSLGGDQFSTFAKMAFILLALGHRVKPKLKRKSVRTILYENKDSYNYIEL
ncbi:MAG: hypothetical protein QM640_16830 [Niabella sp.]